jgi:hypothetical protein
MCTYYVGVGTYFQYRLAIFSTDAMSLNCPQIVLVRNLRTPNKDTAINRYNFKAWAPDVVLWHWATVPFRRSIPQAQMTWMINDDQLNRYYSFHLTINDVSTTLRHWLIGIVCNWHLAGTVRNLSRNACPNWDVKPSRTVSFHAPPPPPFIYSTNTISRTRIFSANLLAISLKTVYHPNIRFLRRHNYRTSINTHSTHTSFGRINCAVNICRCQQFNATL